MILGKTNTPEFGTTAFTDSALNGPCRTPWDLSRNAGGSSGGAAAALAAGLCAISQGSDGGGSIRIPASCCGVFGIKPSRGRVSGAPFVPGIGLGSTGPLARTVADAGRLPRRRLRLRVGRPVPGAAAEAAVRREAAPTRAALRVAFTTVPPFETPVDSACVEAVQRPPSSSPSSGTRSRNELPTGASGGMMDDFRTIWQTAPTGYPDP